MSVINGDILKVLIFLVVFVFNIYIASNNQKIDKSKFVDNPKIILIDIGETLLSVNTMKFPKFFGFLNLLGCTIGNLFIGDSFSFNLKDFYLDKLSLISSPVQAPDYLSKGINGKSMPPLQRDSFRGKLSQKECIAIGDKWIEDNPHQFRNKNQIKAFKKIFHFNFEAESFIQYLKYTSTVKLLKKLYFACDKNGKRKNICIILSNQPKEMIPLIQKYFSDIFKYSDRQVFSCFEGYIKPHPELFEICLSYCPDLSCKICFFIDDEKANIESAKKVNNFTIIGMYPNEAEKTLQRYGVI